MQACERTFWSPTAQLDAQQEIKLFQKQNDISINHFTCDEEVGSIIVANKISIWYLKPSILDIKSYDSGLLRGLSVQKHL